MHNVLVLTAADQVLREEAMLVRPLGPQNNFGAQAICTHHHLQQSLPTALSTHTKYIRLSWQTIVPQSPQISEVSGAYCYRWIGAGGRGACGSAWVNWAEARGWARPCRRLRTHPHRCAGARPWRWAPASPPRAHGSTHQTETVRLSPTTGP